MSTKRIFLTFAAIIFMLFMSCRRVNQTDTKINEESEAHDSIITESIKTEKYTPAQRDSIAITAWGDAKFGQSQAEAEKTIVFRNGLSFDDGSIASDEYDKNLMKALGLTGSIYLRAYYYGEKNSTLYAISGNLATDSYSDFEQYEEVILNRFTELYGEPYFKDNEDLLDNYNSNKSLVAGAWLFESPNNGTKEIICWIKRINKDFYHFDFEITNSKYKRYSFENDNCDGISQEEMEVLENSF